MDKKSLSTKTQIDDSKQLELREPDYQVCRTEGDKHNIISIRNVESNHAKKKKERKLFLAKDKNYSEGI